MNDKINIKGIVLYLLSKWHYFIIAAILLLPGAFLYTKYATKIYQIKASILLKSEHRNDLGEKEFMKGMGLFTSDTELEDEIGILKSYSMVNKAIRGLDFGISYFMEKSFNSEERYGDFPFVVELDSTVNQIINVPIYIEPLPEGGYNIEATGRDVDAYNFLTNRIEDTFDEINVKQVVVAGKPYRTHNLGFVIRPNELYAPKENTGYYFVIHDLSAVVESYQTNLEVHPISRESNIVELALRGNVPHKTARFLDKLLDVYLQNELHKKNQLGVKTIQFIDSQLSGVSDSLKRVEGWLENFRTKSNIQDINYTAENLSKNLDRLESERADLEVKLKYYSYISKSLAEGRFGDVVAPSTFGLEDPLLSSLLIELSKLNQERAGLNYNAKEQNPITEVVDRKIRNTKNTLQENVENIINVTSIALSDLDQRILRIKREFSRLPGNERELVNIQRKFDFSDNVYNYLLEKRAEAGIAIASNTVEKTVVDRAKVVGSGPVSPNNKLVYLTALFFTLAFPIGFIVLKDFWNDHLVSREDIVKATEIPFIGSIIHGSKHEKARVVSEKRTPLTESFQSLRVNLQYLTLGKEKNVIGFTSSLESEGKTFCAVNLASTIAQSGKKTVLIDADMRRPSVSAYFDVENSKGLSNYLVKGCSLKEIIHPTQIEGFHIINSGPIPPNPLNLIGLPLMDQLINDLKQLYDTVIIDAPPVGYVAEYIILMRHTDANIYVVRSNYTSRYHLSKINNLYKERKIRNVSILLNDVRTRLNGYSYTYGAAYQS
ncbi:polysaccharide biosynthesis tyrosine autokinase [Fulvivirga sp. 29W222]|uniref:non-specific protein-tyrosine kinase n=1 Tax=Fulvivirga marina TaxID=2494733 RepID=A0A937G063_9BACT|nr:tyrosine-protein kinase family protein [Fulvivirga marina]MBL6448123.1 polysaccharide biosynthesis tyrosine autokinase [Fulvivirga marina]